MIPQLQKESSKKVAPRCSEIFFPTILKFALLQMNTYALLRFKTRLSGSNIEFASVSLH
jgi:hypothetical protein